MLPAGALPGGSNLNVAYHLQAHGLKAHLISSVGRDELGDQLIEALRTRGIDRDGIGRLDHLATGTVRVSVDASGEPRYEIATNVAWDKMSCESSLPSVGRASALVFGSLAQRSLANRRCLDRLLAQLPPTAWRVLDVNLRAPHDNLAVINRLAQSATLIKVNVQEAARITGVANEAGWEQVQARALAVHARGAMVILTAGARGAGVLRAGRWYWEPARKTLVSDTVGSGDAFLAAFLAGLIAGHPTDQILAYACRVGEWVATHPGGMPDYDRVRLAEARSFGRGAADGAKPIA